MVFSNANYFLNFQKLLGFAKGIKVAQRILLGAMCCGAGTRMCERVRAQLTARGPTGTGSQVDNETSQRQILEMYRKGGAYNGQEIPWDVRKVQPAVEQLEREGVFKGVVLDAGCGFGDNGIFLAQKGYRVVGFDFSPEAISVDVACSIEHRGSRTHTTCLQTTPRMPLSVCNACWVHASHYDT